MGAIFAIIGDESDQALGRRLRSMLERSNYRGEPHAFLVPGAALAIQTLGWDASMAHDDRHVICFHGFIGNWDELKTAFKEITVTEESEATRVARAYGILGDKLFAKLRGEFSILIYHRADRSIKAVRDVIGTRPLFYQLYQGLTYVASEIRQVLAGSCSPIQINDNACAAFLLNSFYSLTDTFYQGVSRVEPAAIYQFEKGERKPTVASYWELPNEPPRSTPSDYRELAEEARHHIELALHRYLPPQEPFAFGLSGGLDSSMMWSILGDWSLRGDMTLSRAHAYSMVFPGMSCDEERLIRLHEARYPGSYHFLDASKLSPMAYTDQMLDTLDHIPNASMYQLYWFAERIQADYPHRHEICGLGGDELFGSPLGYLADELMSGHLWTVASDLITVNMPFEKNYFKILRNQILKPSLQRLRLQPKPWRPPSWLGRSFKHVHAVIENRSSKPIFPTWSQDHFARTMGDHQAGMTLEPREQALSIYGMASRSPLIDVDLIMFAHTLPPRARWQGTSYKALLREAMAPIAPSEITQRFTKTGFNEPYEREQLELKGHLTNSQDWMLAQCGLIEPSEVLKFFSTASSKGAAISNVCFLSRLLQTEFFCRKLVTGPVVGAF